MGVNLISCSMELVEELLAVDEVNFDVDDMPRDTESLEGSVLSELLVKDTWEELSEYWPLLLLLRILRFFGSEPLLLSKHGIFDFLLSVRSWGLGGCSNKLVAKMVGLTLLRINSFLTLDAEFNVQLYGLRLADLSGNF